MPAPPAPPPYFWTGCYIGGNIGGAWSHVEVNDVTTGGTTSGSNGGIAGGGQIGCDYQAGAWVFGIRNMFDGTSLSEIVTFTEIPGNADSSTHWFDTLTARGSYLVVPNVLLYVQGGAAWTNTSVTFFDGTGAQIGELSNGRLVGQSAAVSNGCSRRTGQSLPNIISWASAREVQPFQPVVLAGLFVMSSAPRPIFKMPWLA